MFKECTHHERHDKINALQTNSVQLNTKDLKEEKKLIKLLTKPSCLRPTIAEVLASKEWLVLQGKYRS